MDLIIIFQKNRPAGNMKAEFLFELFLICLNVYQYLN